MSERDSITMTDSFRESNAGIFAGAIQGTTLSGTIITTKIMTDSAIENPKDGTSPYSEATEAEIERLDKLLKSEASHGQWLKHAVCFVLLISNVLVSLLRGSKKSPSLIGISPCSVVGWLFVVLFVAICGVCTWIGIKTVNSE